MSRRLLILATLVLVACGKPSGAPEVAAGPDAEDAKGQHADDTDLPRRLAFMAGHVEAGLALYRGGYPEMAAPHLRHPVSEAYAEERAGLDALGFEPAVFERVSDALAEGAPAAAVETGLAAAEANLAAMASAAGGDAADVIDYLMTLVIEEYAIAVDGGVVTDPGEYQDAWGFVQVAIDRVDALPSDRASEARMALQRLAAHWPVPPAPGPEPATLEQVSKDVRAVREIIATQR